MEGAGAQANRGAAIPRTHEEAGFMTGMFIAVKSFTARTSGRPLEILKGITRLAPGHEFISRFPDAFTEMQSAFDRDELQMAIIAARASGDRETLVVLQRKYRSLGD